MNTYTYVSILCACLTCFYSSVVFAAPVQRLQTKPAVAQKVLSKKNLRSVRATKKPVEKKRTTVTATAAAVHAALPSGALRVPFVTYTITAGDAPFIVRSVTIEQRGSAGLGLFETVMILDDVGESIDEATLSSLGHATIALSAFEIAPHSSKKITVAASTVDDVSAYDGQLPVLRIAALAASEAVPLPETSVSMPVVSTIQIGAGIATRGGDDPVGVRTVFVQDTSIRFGAIRLEASAAEDLLFSGISWRQSGSAGESDVQNMRVRIYGGQPYQQMLEQNLEVDGRDYTASLTTPIRIPHGTSAELVVLGDIGTTGAGRTVRFDIEGSDALVLMGARTKYYVGTTVGGPTSIRDESTFNTSDGTDSGESITPYFYRGSTFTISAGSATYIGR